MQAITADTAIAYITHDDQYITSVKPAQSEATWRLVYIIMPQPYGKRHKAVLLSVGLSVCPITLAHNAASYGYIIDLSM